MIRTRRGRTGRQGRQRTGRGLHPSTAKPRRSEEPVETVLTTGTEADRAESGPGPLPSTEQQRPTDVPEGTATSTGTEGDRAESGIEMHPPTNEERRATDEPQGTATERSTSTDVEAKAGRGLNPFKRQGRKRRPKQPKPLGRYFPVARVDEETVVRPGGVEVSVMEVRGVEADQPLIAAFAGVLNARDFPVQLLVRQHPPRLKSLREAIAGQRPDGLAAGVAAASDSLDGFLVKLEGQTGVVDRRFYAVCERSRSDELHGLISRAGFSVFPLRDKALSSLVQAALAGCAPPALERDGELSLTMRRNRIEIGDRISKTLHLTRWPRSLPPGYLQTVLSLGIPMDVSLHVSSIATAQAARTLEWQKVKMESAASLSLRRGRTAPPEAEIALQDVARLRDQVHRGRERLFHASLSITIYADGVEQLKERELALRGLFAGALASLDRLAFRQHEGHLSTLPLAINAIAAWRTLDTTSVAMLMPFAPPDLDTRRGTLFGLDLRSGSPVTFDFFDPAFLNANTVVMARSGAGKSFSMKLGLLRGITRGIVYYVIDPEGEYSSIAEAAGGRVLTPGVPGHGRAIVGHSGRVLLQNSAFKLLLQQDAAALAAVAESFDLSASDVQWLLSAPRGDGMLIARGGRFPVRVLATPEEHRLIDAVRGTGSSTTETEQAGTSNSQQ